MPERERQRWEPEEPSDSVGIWLVLAHAGLPAAQHLESVAAIRGVLALDPAAVGWAQARGLPFLTPADLLTRSELDGYREAASAVAAAFIQNVSTILDGSAGRDGPRVHRFDEFSIREWVLRVLVSSEATKRLAAERGEVQIACSSEGAGAGSVITSGPGAFDMFLPWVLQDLAPDRLLRIVEAPADVRRLSSGVRRATVELRPQARGFRKRARRARDLIRGLLLHGSRRIPARSVVVVARHYEIRRHRHIWPDLAPDLSPIVIDVGDSRDRDRATAVRLAVKNSRRFGHRFHWLPRNRQSGLSTIDFATAVDEALAAVRGVLHATAPDEVEVALIALEAIRSVLPTRWSEWDREWRFWERRWPMIRPQSVVGVRNGLPDVIPLEVAAELGIPTVTIGHGHAERPDDESVLSFGSGVRHLVPREDPRPVPENFVKASGVLTKWAYEDSEARPPSVMSHPNRPRVLILCDSTTLFTLGTRSAMAALDLIHAASERLPEVNFVLKEHPSEKIWSNVLRTRARTAIVVEDELSDLHLLLPESAGVLLLAGYCGSAAIHAVAAGLPALRVGATLDDRDGSDGHRFWGPELDAAIPVADAVGEIVTFVHGLGAERPGGSAAVRESDRETPSLRQLIIGQSGSSPLGVRV